MTWLSAESRRKIWAVYYSQGTAPGNWALLCVLWQRSAHGNDVYSIHTTVLSLNS